MSSKFKLIFALLVVGPLLSLIPTTLLIYGHWSSSYSGGPVTFEIKDGEGFASINQRLSRQNLISSPRIFHYYARYKNLMTKLKTGVYEINSGMRMVDIINLFVSGKGIMKALTIPEGKNIYEISQIVEQAGFGLATEFVNLCKDADFIKSLGLEGRTLEGYLYPETYNFSPKTSQIDILKGMVQLFKKKTENLDLSKTDLSWEQVLTLASIVEKETGAGFERAQIAGVFINRLNRKMRLQSDPTIIYGIWERYDGNIRKKDILEKTDYNTYQINGLPPGPISNPGIDSIEAVLNPENHDYLFFVSYNDGTHKFSKTYKEHLKAVEDFQMSRKNRVGKSWRQLDQKHRTRK